jgi:hypothetical protein
LRRIAEVLDCATHWFGGPELAIEIVSPGDRTLEKLDFYARVGTQELLVIDRDPWQLTLYRVNLDQKMVPVAVSRFEMPTRVDLGIFPLSFQLNPQTKTKTKTKTLDVIRDTVTLVVAIPLRQATQG